MTSLFQNLGLNEKETRVWLKLLELGAQPVSVIAKHADLARSSMYAIMEKLKRTNLVEEFDRSGIRYVKCIRPREIAGILKTHERTIEQTLLELEHALPQLEKLENKLSITPTVRFYEGKKAVMKMYEAVIQENGFFAYFNPAVVSAVMPEYYFRLAEMLEKRNGEAKELLIAGEKAQQYKKRFESELHKIKFLPYGAEFFSDTIICKNKIFMISYGDKQMSGTEITNPALAQTQRAVFEELWKKT